MLPICLALEQRHYGMNMNLAICIRGEKTRYAIYLEIKEGHLQNVLCY